MVIRSGDSGIQTFPGGPFVITLDKFFDFPRVTGKSRVVASITEVDRDGQPIIGKATLYIENVTPYNNGKIGVKVTNTFDAAVRYRITWFVSP